MTLTMLSAGACGTSDAGWTEVEKYTGVRTDSSRWPSPPMKLDAGVVRVSGTVTYDKPKYKYFFLALAPKDPTGPNRTYSFEMVAEPGGDPRTQTFSGSLENVEAGEYWLVTMSPPATCDVTVYQKGGG